MRFPPVLSLMLSRGIDLGFCPAYFRMASHMRATSALLMDLVLRCIAIWAWHLLIFPAGHRPQMCLCTSADALSPSFCMLPYLFHVMLHPHPVPACYHISSKKNAASSSSSCMLSYFAQVGADALSPSCRTSSTCASARRLLETH